MRRLALAIAIGVLAATGALVVSPQGAKAVAVQAKVVIVVGATQGATDSYRSDADAAAAVFAKYTSNITKVYSPNATWSAVAAAAKGANILVYLGHGSGYPDPYVGYEQPNSDNGMGLNASAANTNNNLKYYGENYMAQLGLAPDAVVILNHLCYASGDNEWGQGLPTLAVAQQRVDGYASGFLRGGAKAVIAEGVSGLSSYIDGLFTSHSTIDALWKSAPDFNNHVSSWPSTRNAGFTSAIDPNLDHPAPDGDVYYRSMVAVPGLSTDDVISGQTSPFASQSGTYYPIAPTRVVDTRGNGIGPVGSLTSGGAYTFQIAGDDGVPSIAIAVTANLTVTGQSARGWVYVAPTIDSTPTASTINFPTADNRANGVTVALSPQGTISAWYGAAAGATTQLIVDVTGYFLADSSGAGYAPYGPYRILDTRDGTGLSGAFQAGVPRKIQVAGVAGLPDSGIVAVTGTLTVVRPTVKGYVYVGPTARTSPTSSTINFPAGDIRANNVTVPVNSDGTVAADYAAPSGSVNLVLDISGYFTATGGALYHTLVPTRMLDTRTSMGGIIGPLAASSPVTLQVTSNGGVPTGALAIAANLTATGQTAGGFAAVGPTINASTPFSNLNFPYGDCRADGLTVPLASDGTAQLIYVAPGGNTAQLILDVGGYYQ